MLSRSPEPRPIGGSLEAIGQVASGVGACVGVALTFGFWQPSTDKHLVPIQGIELSPMRDDASGGDD